MSMPIDMMSEVILAIQVFSHASVYLLPLLCLPLLDHSLSNCVI